MKKKYKYILLVIWSIIIAIVCIKYQVSAASVAAIIREYKTGAVIIYLLLSSIRGLFFLPSTPFIFAGLLIFPGKEDLVFILSFSAIIISASLIYFFAEYLDIAKFFPVKNRETKIASFREKLSSPKGYLFIIAWAFLPVTPTDLVSYVAGTVRMNYLRFILPLALGESVVCALYVYAGSDIWHLLNL